MFNVQNRMAPLVFHSLYIIKPPGKYSLQTEHTVFKPLKRTKIGQFSISFPGLFFVEQNSHIENSFNPLFKYKLKEFIFSLNEPIIY